MQIKICNELTICYLLIFCTKLQRVALLSLDQLLIANIALSVFVKPPSHTISPIALPSMGTRFILSTRFVWIDFFCYIDFNFVIT